MATKKKPSSTKTSMGKKTAGKKANYASAKKVIKKLHPITVAVVVIFAVLGIGLGALAGYLFSKNDRFVLKGNSSYSLDVSDTDYIYKEEGVSAYCFGFDVSSKLVVETSLKKNAQGDYIIPTKEEGVYYIKYTIDFFKFGADAPNGLIVRVRTFTVNSSEDDGRMEENTDA